MHEKTLSGIVNSRGATTATVGGFCEEALVITDEGAPRVVLAGGRGFGARYIDTLRTHEAAGRLRLTAIADPALADETTSLDSVPVFPSLDEALNAGEADIVIIATPIGTHAALCESALRAGADVLLEKPPVPSFADFEHLLAVQRETGVAVQVGFQSLGSQALSALADDSFGLGRLDAVSAVGLWCRPLGYWSRSRWAGKRVLDGHPVVDGVATNPLAHAVATALSVASIREAADVVAVDTELYRANKIEADDTSVIRVTGASGIRVTCALSLCAPPTDAANRGAWVTLHGDRGRAEFSYTTDVVTHASGSESFGRDELLLNLIDHRKTGKKLLVPLNSTGAFMRVVEAIRTADEPVSIAPEFVSWRGEGDDAFPVVDDIESLAREAAESGTTFSEQGAPWAFTGRDRITATARVAGRDVASYRDGGGTIPFSSPRPYFHPVSTQSGVVVSAHHAADHDWHLGLGFAVQDVDGVNFWGGRTYVAERGYVPLDDHGQITGEPPEALPDGFRQQLEWHGPRGRSILSETRTVSWRSVDERSWELELDVMLRTTGGADVTLGSPGSKGRVGAGYGGLFWRLPACENVRITTADAEGEDAVNGSRSAWIAWSGRFSAGPGVSGEATLIIAGADEETRRDPWFVRRHDYPGFGSAIAWDAPTIVSADAGLRRRYRISIADGVLTPEQIRSRADERGAP